MGKIHLVFDGNNLCYRCNCVTELYTKQGQRTSAILGTLNAVHSNVKSLSNKCNKPVSEIIMAFDKGHSQRRKTVFPDYKSNRKKEKSDEDKEWMSEFIAQANILYEKLPLFGVKTMRQTGWEGDDLIYSITSQLTSQNPDDISVIISTDEDFHQLVSDTVYLYSPVKEVLYTPENYEELMGIPQELFLTYKIIKGDSSDGIPGIAGIGEKTGKSLVNEYGNLEGILSAKEELCKSARTRKIFTQEGLEILNRNNQLINLKDFVDVSDITDSVQELLAEEPFVDTHQCKDFLMKYQLTSILVKYKKFIEPFEEVVENFS